MNKNLISNLQGLLYDKNIKAGLKDSYYNMIPVLHFRNSELHIYAIIRREAVNSSSDEGIMNENPIYKFSHKLMSSSVVETLLPRFVDLSTDLGEPPFSVEMFCF